MDFVGVVSKEIFDISWYWWIVLFAVMAGTWVITNTRKKRITETLLVGYILLIQIVTLLNRSFTVAEPQFGLFWSYGNSELRSEILLNYILFIPLGILLDCKSGDESGWKKYFRNWLFAAVLSFSIEILQLVFNRGLFEFDDVVGNSIGCLLGAIGCHFIRRFVK